jgi:hypothetical protein
MTLTLVVLLGVAIWLAVHFSKVHTDRAIAAALAQRDLPSPSAPAPAVPEPIQAIRAALASAGKWDESEQDIIKNAVEYSFKRHSEEEQEASMAVYQRFLGELRETLAGMDQEAKTGMTFLGPKIDAVLQTVPVGTLGYHKIREQGIKFLDMQLQGPNPEAAEAGVRIRASWKEEDQLRMLKAYGEMKKTALQALRASVREQLDKAQAQGLDVSAEEEMFRRVG